MNLIELLFLMAAIAGGIWFGLRLGSPYGKIGIAAGFILGTIATLASLFGVIKLLLALVSKCWPPFPVCRKGKCGNGDYRWIGRLEDGTGVIFRCKCGTKYAMKSKSPFGRYIKVLELLDDGSTRPYMKYVRHFDILGRWVKEST